MKALLYLVSASAWADEVLKPVTTSASLSNDLWFLVPAGIAVAAVIGYLWLKHRHAAAAAQVATTAATAATGVASELTSLLHKAHDVISAQHATINAQAAAPAQPVPAAGTAESLGLTPRSKP